jgi:hypothetical protein
MILTHFLLSFFIVLELCIRADSTILPMKAALHGVAKPRPLREAKSLTKVLLYWSYVLGFDPTIYRLKPPYTELRSNSPFVGD